MFLCSEISWFVDETVCDDLQTLVTRIDSVVFDLHAELPGLTSSNASIVRDRCMMAEFPGGGSVFTRHRDNPKGVKNGRMITAIYYLNVDWQPEHGGCLRVNVPQIDESSANRRCRTVPRDVEPVADRLVLLDARRLPHEVLPCHQKRRAVVVWYSDEQEMLQYAAAHNLSNE